MQQGQLPAEPARRPPIRPLSPHPGDHQGAAIPAEYLGNRHRARLAEPGQATSLGAEASSRGAQLRACDLGERDPAIGEHAPVVTDAMLAAEAPAIPQPGAEQLLELRRHAPGPGCRHPALAGWVGSSSASWAARPAAAGCTRSKASA